MASGIVKLQPNWANIVVCMCNVQLYVTYTFFRLGVLQLAHLLADVHLLFCQWYQDASVFRSAAISLVKKFTNGCSPPCHRGHDIFTAALYWSERALITINGVFRRYDYNLLMRLKLLKDCERTAAQSCSHHITAWDRYVIWSLAVNSEHFMSLCHC